MLNGYELTLKEIEHVLNIFISHDLDYLINALHIHPKRADVITAGTLILAESLKNLETKHVIVSTKGLRYGLIKSFTDK